MNKRKIAFILSSLIVAVLFCFNEYFVSFSPDPDKYIVLRRFLKFGMSAIPFLLVFSSWKSTKKKENFWFMAGFFLCLVGDVTINIILVSGALFYLLGHVMFIKGFLLFKKPSKIQIITWIAICATLVSAILILFFNNKNITLLTAITGIVYSVFMTAMVTFSFCAPKQICAGGVIFGISDLLLMRNIAFEQTPVSHIISLGAYYIGVMIMVEKIYRLENN